MVVITVMNTEKKKKNQRKPKSEVNSFRFRESSLTAKAIRNETVFEVQSHLSDAPLIST